MKSLKFLQLKNRNPGGRQTRHSFAFFRTQDEGISNVNIPPSLREPKLDSKRESKRESKLEAKRLQQLQREQDAAEFASAFKTYLAKKKNRSNRRQSVAQNVRSSTVEPITITTLREEIQQREAALRTLENRIKGMESEKEKVIHDLEQVQIQLKDRGQEVKDLRSSLLERDHTTAQLNDALSKFKKEKVNLQIELDRTKSELKVREGEIRELNFSLLECAHDLQSTKTDLAATISESDIAIEELQIQLKEREQLVRNHATQIKTLKRDLEVTQQDLANAQNELSAAQAMCSAEIEAAQAMCSAELEATKAKSLAEIGVIRAKYAAELHATKEEHADELEATKAQLSFFKSQLDSTKAQLSFTKSKLEWAKADLSSIKGLLDTTKSDLAATNNKYKRQNAELKATRSELEESIEMIAHRDGITSYIIQVYQEDIKCEKERLGAELDDTQEQLNKIKATHEKEKKANAKTIKQLTSQVQNLTNQQVQEKAKLFQLEGENNKLRKQLEQTKSQASEHLLMKEEIARLHSQVIQLKNLSKKRNSIAQLYDTPKHFVGPSTPPESPCNSFSNNDLFSDLRQEAKLMQNSSEEHQINGSSDDWVTVKKKNSNKRSSKGSLRSSKSSPNRGGRRVRILSFASLSIFFVPSNSRFHEKSTWLLPFTRRH
ncbi:10853_t:CDS:2 [Funneliformis mosseae]|uniref:10853_t:CDS:1 n=1 Tax=Funneliformis mosseae TaxID=27381 RepID=A0A9N9FFQ2_FUNMO|nr:10853_t:CDS:2 [Funneliformis mosseae]